MKLLITLFGWVPVLGQALKLMYVAKCAKDALSNVSVATAEQQENSADYIKDIADGLYEDHVKQEVDSLGMPAFLTNKAKDKALSILAEGIKSKLLKN